MPLEAWFTKRNLFRKKSTPVQTFSSVERWGSNFFYAIGNSNNIFGSENDYAKWFLEIPELNAILNIRARALASAVFSIISKTTGEEQKNNQSLVRILRQPNWFQGQKEFWRQLSLYRDIYGNAYIYFLTPVGMPSTYKGMFLLDPSKVTCKFKNNDPYFFVAADDDVQYTYNHKGKEIPIDKEFLIHLNDNRVDGKTPLTGISKLKALEAPLKNIKAAYQKRNVILNMPIGVLSNNNNNDASGVRLPLDSEEKDDALQALRSRGSLPIITNMGLSYNDMSINAANMGLYEECKQDTAKVCDSFGVPYEILASESGTTFTNLKEAKKQMYEEGTIPDMEEYTNALNNYFESKANGNLSWEIKASYDHLPVFSENVKERSQSLNTLTMALNRAKMDGILTDEQYRIELEKFGIK